MIITDFDHSELRDLSSFTVFLSTQIIFLLLKSVLDTIYYCFWLSV